LALSLKHLVLVVQMIPWIKYLVLYLSSFFSPGLLQRKISSACPFCGIVETESYRIVRADATTAVLLASYQMRPGHLLVVPRRHVVSFRELCDDELTELFLCARWAARVLVASGIADGVNIAVNDGLAAGQTVLHVHVHVLPRHQGDLRLAFAWANPALLFSGRRLSRSTAEDLRKRICNAGG
jgi:diadenosine tetraphosphate (Ap4A) HIT family hydrolase